MFSLSKNVCVILIFQYAASYLIVHVIVIKNNKGPSFTTHFFYPVDCATSDTMLAFEATRY